MSLRHHLERVKPNALPAPSALVLGLALFAAALTVLPRGWVVEVGRPAKALILLFGLALALPLALQRSVGRRACLLYTSPSPRDRTRSRMPSSA